MNGPFPSSIQSIIMLVTMVVLTGLTIYLPWRKKTSATNMISLSILLIFIMQLLFTSRMLYDLPFMDGVDRISSIQMYREIGFLPDAIVKDKALYQFISSTYLHGSFLHLIFNFIGLFLLGVQLERKIGWYRFLVLYFGSGVIAGAVVLIISPFNAVGHAMDIPSIGASGCIFGILGGYWFLYPKDKIFFPLPLIFFRLYNTWPISLIFLIYGGITTFFLLIGSGDNTSHIAHFGGLIGAFPIAALIRPPLQKEKVKVMRSEDLSRFARTKKQREYLKRAMDSDEEDIRNAWLDEFFNNIACPKCKASRMTYEEGKGICPGCGNVIKP